MGMTPNSSMWSLRKDMLIYGRTATHKHITIHVNFAYCLRVIYTKVQVSPSQLLIRMIGSFGMKVREPQKSSTQLGSCPGNT